MLPDQGLLETKIQSTPDELARLLRSGGDVFWWERGGFFVVTKYKLAEHVLRSSDYSADRSSFFISRMPNLDLRLIRDFFGVISKMMVMSDGTEHAIRRKTAGMGLTDELLDYYRPLIEKTVARLVDSAVKEGTIEFVERLAQPLPSVVLADLFDIPEEARSDFYRWSNNMTQFFGGASQYRNEDGTEVNESATHIRDYFRKLIAKRREFPGDDFLSIMLRNQARFGLTDEEVVSQAVMMLVAGQITTTDQLCNNLFSLLTRDGVRDDLVADPSLLPTAMEELNRLDPAVTFLFRVAKHETELGGVKIPPQGVVFIANHAVNRDPEMFESADECLIGRRHNPHFAYGYGPHFCLGAKLARIQMIALFGELLRRFPHLRLAGEAVRKHHSLAFSGFEKMELSVEGTSELLISTSIPVTGSEDHRAPIAAV
jgi:cytochrome P450